MSDSLDPISTIGGGGGGSGGDSLSSASDLTSVQLSTIKVSTLITYIKEVVSPALEGRSYVHPSLINLLEDLSCQEKLRRFITDSQVKSILIQRISEDEEASGHSSESNDNIVFSIVEEADYSNPLIGHILIKKSPVLKENKNISSQLLYMRLDETNILEPFLPFSVNSQRDNLMDHLIKMRTNELETELSEPNVPEINIQIHPTIVAVMKKCAKEGRKATVNDFADRMDNTVFLDQLDYRICRFICEMNKVSKLDRDASTGTALQEINFWLNLERDLLRIQKKRETPEVALTLDILKKGKSFFSEHIPRVDSRLKNVLVKINDFNPLLKNFPIKDLLSTDLSRIRSTFPKIFRKMKVINDSLMERAINLIEAISRDLVTQFLEVLKTRKIMEIPYEEFQELIFDCQEVLSIYDQGYREMRLFYQKKLGVKSDEKLWKMKFKHHKIELLLKRIQCFRQNHKNFRHFVVRVTSLISNSKTDSGGLNENYEHNIIAEVDLAYELVAKVIPLDLSSEGSDTWEEALKRYEKRTDRVEVQIMDGIRDQLDKAKDSKEMFRIFSCISFNYISFRFREVNRQYQTKLIQLVKDDIKVLHDKFESEEYLYDDIPPVAGIFFQNFEIEIRLVTIKNQLNSALSNYWENDVEGKKLLDYINSLYNQLNTELLCEEWVHDAQQRLLTISESIFIVESRSEQENDLKLTVNLRILIIFTLPEEVRIVNTLCPSDLRLRLKNQSSYKEIKEKSWERLCFLIPETIGNKADIVYKILPSVVSLVRSVVSYEKACEKINDKPTVILLMAEMKNDVQTILSRGVSLVWESDELDTYVYGLDDFLLDFHEKVDELLVIIEQIEIEMKNLETCAYSSTVFAEILNRIQKSVHYLNNHCYSNISQWVNKLNEEIEKRLASRLHAGIKAWTSALVGQEKDDMDVIPDTETVTTPVCKAGGEPKIQALHHELRIVNQVLYIHPSIEEARFNLLQQLFTWQNVILSLKRIQSTWSQVDSNRSSVPQYRTVVKKMTDGHTAIEQVYEAIEDKIKQMKIYVDQWIKYQSLWDLQPEMLYDQLGEDILKWTNTLTEIKKSRSIFDTTETRKELKPIIIDYTEVQSKVITKYHSWRNEILSQFQILLRQKYY